MDYDYDVYGYLDYEEFDFLDVYFDFYNLEEDKEYTKKLNEKGTICNYMNRNKENMHEYVYQVCIFRENYYIFVNYCYFCKKAIYEKPTSVFIGKELNEEIVLNHWKRRCINKYAIKIQRIWRRIRAVRKLYPIMLQYIYRPGGAMSKKLSEHYKQIQMLREFKRIQWKKEITAL